MTINFLVRLPCFSLKIDNDLASATFIISSLEEQSEQVPARENMDSKAQIPLKPQTGNKAVEETSQTSSIKPPQDNENLLLSAQKALIDVVLLYDEKLVGLLSKKLNLYKDMEGSAGVPLKVLETQNEQIDTNQRKDFGKRDMETTKALDIAKNKIKNNSTLEQKYKQLEETFNSQVSPLAGRVAYFEAFVDKKLNLLSNIQYQKKLNKTPDQYLVDELIRMPSISHMNSMYDSITNDLNTHKSLLKDMIVNI